ncbi:MAG: hypothetical protein CME70_11790 [Halobacteriovorax sp.]|nr:hypothetical protein [Halobacteriovorax sp.]|tara:strand:- start:3726 stop:4112 length:387 start_codon:yes stop_codon:yes gene_type:complete
MNIAILCVFIASLLPVIFIAYAKVTGGFKAGKHNSDPRAYMAKLEGKAHRARCAHDNSWENFAPFAAAVTLSMIAGTDQSCIDMVAVGFIVLRVAYGLSYIYDKDKLRTILYTGGLVCTGSLFVMAAF